MVDIGSKYSMSQIGLCDFFLNDKILAEKSEDWNEFFHSEPQNKNVQGDPFKTSQTSGVAPCKRPF